MRHAFELPRSTAARVVPPDEPVRVQIPIVWLHHGFLPGHRVGILDHLERAPHRSTQPRHWPSAAGRNQAANSEWPSTAGSGNLPD
jgi:hypothetical protein